MMDITRSLSPAASPRQWPHHPSRPCIKIGHDMVRHLDPPHASGVAVADVTAPRYQM
jgi:hypothetical protein